MPVEYHTSLSFTKKCETYSTIKRLRDMVRQVKLAFFLFPEQFSGEVQSAPQLEKDRPKKYHSGCNPVYAACIYYEQTAFRT